MISPAICSILSADLKLGIAIYPFISRDIRGAFVDFSNNSDPNNEQFELGDTRLTHSTAKHTIETGHILGYDIAEIVDHGKTIGELKIKKALAI